MKPQSNHPYLLTFTWVTLVYTLAGKFCLHFAFVHPSASPIWIPSGIALTALLVSGIRFWPAIFLGAFVVNMTTMGTAITSLGIAMGNTLEAVVAAYLVNTFAHGRRALDQAEDVLKFVILAGFVSTAISPSFGVSSLAVTGFVPVSQYLPVWITWWLGDAGGMIVAAPFFLLWTIPRVKPWSRRKSFEAAFFGTALLYLSLMVFHAVVFPKSAKFPLEYLCIPPVICIAYRLGQRATATATFTLAWIALWGTLQGYGPFSQSNHNNAVMLMDTFLIVISIMGLILAAVVAEREKSDLEVMSAREDLERRVHERTLSLARTIGDLQAEVTERKLIERTLRESEERFRLLIENVNDYAIFMLDPEGLIVSWNSGAERIKGYKAEEILGRHVSLFYPPEEIAQGKPQTLLQQAAEEGRAEDTGLRQRKDGSIFWADAVYTALFDKQNQLRGFAKITRDVTERHKSEKEIQLYQDIVKNTQLGVGVLRLENLEDDKSLRLIATNPSASQIAGLEHGSMTGKNLWEVFPDLYKTLVPHQLAEVVRLNRPLDIGELQYGDANVKEGLYYLRAFPLPDQSVGVIFENITERRKTEEALSHSEERFRQLVDSNIIGFMLMDKTGRILEANDALLTLLGYTREDLQTQTLNEEALTPPQFRMLDQWIEDRLQSGGICPSIEKEFIRKDGCRIPVLVGLVRLTGTEQHQLCFVIDVTERRGAQDALRKAYDELELRVQQRTMELQEEIQRRERAEEELRNQAIRDPLTGLYNRRGFMTLSENQMQLAARQGAPLLLFMGDLDDLKKINDQFGHAEGDFALARIGDILRKTFRQSDVIARIGGDEFAMIGIEDADHTAESLNERLQQHLDDYNRYSGRQYRLHLSVGTSRIEPHNTGSLENLMQQADATLYEKKRNKKSTLSKGPTHII